MERWQDPKTFAIGLALIILVFLLLVAFVFILARAYSKRLLKEQEEQNRLKLNHQKELIAALVDTQEKERSRIAADLHDGLVSKLRVIHLMLTTNQQVEGKDPINMLAESIELSREISHDLMPPMLDDSSFEDLIFEASLILTDNYNTKVQVFGEEILNVAVDVKLQFFRIVKEVINNLDKHAKAKNVNVLLKQSDNGITLKIEDDGCGIPKDMKNKGLGMKNIELRAQKIGASYKFKNRKFSGTVFILYIPIQF